MRFPRGRCEEIEKCAGEGSDVVAGKSTESNHVHGVVGVGIVDVEEEGGQGVVKEGGSVCCLDVWISKRVGTNVLWICV